MDLESEFEILGLFSGPDLADREGGSNAPQQTMIFLYRRPILDYWAEHAEPLGHIVRHVLIHEIGHHFGLSDDDMEGDRGAASESGRERIEPLGVVDGAAAALVAREQHETR